MNFDAILNGIIVPVFGLIGWLFTENSKKHREHNEKHEQHERTLNEFKLEVVKEFVPKSEIRDTLSDINKKLDVIFELIHKKADKQ